MNHSCRSTRRSNSCGNPQRWEESNWFAIFLRANVTNPCVGSEIPGRAAPAPREDLSNPCWQRRGQPEKLADRETQPLWTCTAAEYPCPHLDTLTIRRQHQGRKSATESRISIAATQAAAFATFRRRDIYTAYSFKRRVFPVQVLWAIILIRNVRQDGGGLWRTRAVHAKIVPLDRGWAGFVPLPAEGFASSSL